MENKHRIIFFKNVILKIFSYLCFAIIFTETLLAQCPFSSIQKEDTICPVFEFTAVNQDTINKFSWDFRPGALITKPALLGTPGILAHLILKAISYNNQYYLFYPPYDSTQLYRVEYGNSFSNTPLTVPTGYSDTTTNTSLAFDMIKDTGLAWVGFIADYNTNKFFRVDFDSINDNQLKYTDLNVPGLSIVRTIKIIDKSVFILGYLQNSIVRLDFNGSFYNSYSLNQVTLPGNGMTGLDVVYDCNYNEYFCFVGNTIINKFFRLELGSTLFNNNPNTIELESPGLAQPNNLLMAHDNNKWYLFTNNSVPRLMQYELGDIKNDTAIIITDTISSFWSLPFGISMLYDSSKYHVFVSSYGNGYVGRMEFSSQLTYANSWQNSPVPSNFIYGDSVSGYQYFNITATDSNHTTYYKTDSIYLGITAPKVDFSNTPGCFGSDIYFLDLSEGCLDTIISWNWDFGDSVGSSSLQNPSYLYANPGNYIVTLTVTSSSGYISQSEKTISVQPPPVATFSISDSICSYTELPLVNNSYSPVGLPILVLWDFGNGDSSNQFTPNYQYLYNGNYQLNLIVTDSNFCKDSTLKTVYVEPSPISAFETFNTCLTDDALFLNLTDSNGLFNVSYLWDFGDTLFSNDPFPTHHFVNGPGNYNVTLYSTGSNGCSDSLVQVITISNKANPNFTFLPLQVCVGNICNFYDSSTASPSDSIILKTWNFGDNSAIEYGDSVNHIYLLPGNYQVELIVKTKTNCDTSIIKIIQVIASPQANFAFTNACYGTANSFSDSSQIQPGDSILQVNWLFGDNNFASGFSASHIYSQPGNYTVTQVVTSQAGCIDSGFQSVTVYNLPVANFTNSALSCTNDTTYFNNQSTINIDTITNFIWNFGNGIFTSGPNTFHIYNLSGLDSVTLTVYTNQGCTDSITKIINTAKSPSPDFTFTGNCQNNIIAFTAINLDTTNVIAGWNWNFTDGGSSGLTNPIHVFTTAGNFNVELKANAVNGCKSTKANSVNIDPQPLPAISITNPCSNQLTILTDSSQVSSGQINQWLWVINQTDTFNSASISFIKPNASVVSLQFIPTTNAGCSDTLNSLIQIFQTPIADFTVSPLFATPGQLITFTNQTVFQSWWNFGDLTSDTGYIVTHSYIDTGQYKVTMFITSDEGCIDSVTNLFPVIFPKPDLAVTNATATLNSGLLTIKARVQNLSNFNVTNWQIKAEVADASVFYEFPLLPIAINGYRDYTFQSNVFIDGEDPGYVCVVVDKPNGMQDINFSNNTSCKNAFDAFEILSIPTMPVENSLIINFSLPEASIIKLKIFDTKGSLVLNYEIGKMPKGFNELNLDVSGLSNALYNLTLENLNDFKTAKFIKY